MSSKLSPWYVSEKNRRDKTTPKYDPWTSNNKRRDSRSKPSAHHVKSNGVMHVEDGHKVWRLEWRNGKTYKVREKMTQAEHDEYVIRRWREANGHAATVIGIDPGSPDGDVTVTGRIVQAARGNKGMYVLYDELSNIDPTIWDVMQDAVKDECEK